ncbi:MAG TPA: tripartite tricarboxylate transporter substrate binding protein [Thermodesulfobacteriota bacterium]
MRRQFLLTALGMVLLASVSTPAAGQSEYPSRPIELVVPYATGGSTDILARILAKYVSEKKGIAFNVVNRPGGSGIIGVREVLNARPDGYTLLADTHGASTMIGAFNDPADVPFDWRNRTWIGMMDKDVILYLVKEDSPWKTLKDVAEYARQNPKKFRWGTTGRGGIAIPAMQQFFEASGIPADAVADTQVLFKSGGEGPVALAAGNIDFAAQQIPEALGLIQAKRIRALAVISDERLPLFPDVPTVAEAGYPMIDVAGWHGVSGPPGLPRNVVDYWVTLLKEANADPVFRDMLEQVRKVPVFLGPEELRAFAEKEYEKYLDVARKLGWRK